MFNPSNVLTLSRNYEPYGTTYSAMGNRTTAYGFTGEWMDGNGLVNLRARYYLPSNGRFMSRDIWDGNIQFPISYNFWIFGYANPQKYIDPTGYYGDYVHYTLTRRKVLLDGQSRPALSIFDLERLSIVIASWDLKVDRSAILSSVGTCPGCHFQTQNITLARVNNAIDLGEPYLFGGSLHLLEDYYSHWYEGYHNQFLGHGVHGILAKSRGISSFSEPLLSDFFYGGHGDKSGFWKPSLFPAHPRNQVIANIRSRNPNLINYYQLTDWDLIDLYLRNDNNGSNYSLTLLERDYFGFDTDKYFQGSDREIKMENTLNVYIGLYLYKLSSTLSIPYCEFDLGLPPDIYKEFNIHKLLVYGIE